MAAFLVKNIFLRSSCLPTKDLQNFRFDRTSKFLFKATNPRLDKRTAANTVFRCFVYIGQRHNIDLTFEVRLYSLAVTY